jgi:RimJ/RimL family protein N-acetyltransferase
VKERLMAVCEPENKGSLRVLEKCGFKEVRRFVFEANGDALVEFLFERPENS